MSRQVSLALLVGCLALSTGCPTTDGGVEAGQFGVTVSFENQFGGFAECSSIELVVVSSAGDVFRDPGNCVDFDWETDLLPLEQYSAQVNMYDRDGFLSAQSPVQLASIDLDNELVELAFTIVEDAGNFALSWFFTGEISGADLTCAEVGAADLVLETTLVSDSSAWDGQFLCTDLEGIGPYVPLGDFTLVAAVKDSAGVELGATLGRNLTITHGGHLNDLGDIEFVVDGL